MSGSNRTEYDYRMVLKAMSIDEKKALMVLTNHHGLMQLSGHLCLVGLLAYGQSVSEGLLRFGFLVGQGAVMVFLFCAMHEASHGTAFRTKWLNKLVTNGVGLLLFMGARWFTYFHNAHHRYTNDKARDPELAGDKPHNWYSYLWYLSGIMIWVSYFGALVKHAFTPPQADYIPQSGKRLVQIEARAMLIFYIILMTVLSVALPDVLLYYWLLPLLCGQPFLRLFLLAEHTNCPDDDDMLKNSRTIYTNPVLLALSWQMPYHTAHHSFPAVPFHKLARFHAAIHHHVKNATEGYGAFHSQMITHYRKRP